MNQIENYAVDTFRILVEMARQAQGERDLARGTKDYDLRLGRLMAYHEIVSLLQQQAEAFGISRAALGLGDVEPDRDLL